MAVGCDRLLMQGVRDHEKALAETYRADLAEHEVARDLWAGKTTWSELADSPEGIATNILADRLQKLVEQGLVAREPATGRARSYGLTRLGLSLEPVLAAMRDWGLANVAGTEARVGSVAEERNGASRKPRPTP